MGLSVGGLFGKVKKFLEEHPKKVGAVIGAIGTAVANKLGAVDAVVGILNAIFGS